LQDAELFHTAGPIPVRYSKIVPAQVPRGTLLFFVWTGHHWPNPAELEISALTKLFLTKKKKAEK
jgi:hypothetical protein